MFVSFTLNLHITLRTLHILTYIYSCIHNVKQPHQTSDMLTNFKMIFCVHIFKNVDDLASKCKNNYGAAAKIGKVMKDYVQKG